MAQNKDVAKLCNLEWPFNETRGTWMRCMPVALPRWVYICTGWTGRPRICVWKPVQSYARLR